MPSAWPPSGNGERFGFDNKDGRGTFICKKCGAGDGMKLAQEFTGMPFAEVASQIDVILGNVKPDAPGRPAMTADQRTRALRRAWVDSRAVTPGDLADTYLRGRGLGEAICPKALRFGPAMQDGAGGIRPAMLALFGVWGEKPVSLNRTHLKPDGMGKAKMDTPRK